MSSPNKRPPEDAAGPPAKRCRSLERYSKASMNAIMSKMSKQMPDRVPESASWVKENQRVKLVTADGKSAEIELAPREVVGWWNEDGSNCKIQMFFDPNDTSDGHLFLKKYLSDELIEAYATHAPEMWGKAPRVATKKGLSERNFEDIKQLITADVQAGPGVKPEAFNTPFKVKAEDGEGNTAHKFTFTLYTLREGEAQPSTKAEAKDSLPPGHPLLNALLSGDSDLANMNVSVADRRGAADLTSLKTLGSMSFKTAGEGGKWMLKAGAAMRIGGISFKWTAARKCFTVSMYLNGPGMTCVGLYEGGSAVDSRPPEAAADVYDELGIDVDAADAYDAAAGTA